MWYHRAIRESRREPAPPVPVRQCAQLQRGRFSAPCRARPQQAPGRLAAGPQSGAAAVRGGREQGLVRAQPLSPRWPQPAR
jgi:hypothetical protein